MATLSEMHRESIDDPRGFWGRAAQLVDWITPPEQVLDSSRAPMYRWFAGGELNTCANALDRHADGGRAEQPAVIYDSPVTGTTRTFTYGELRDRVARVAGALRSLGVERGDRVVIYMPVIPEALMTMLACARLGAVHSVVFGGFAPNELALRIDDAEPKVVVAASCGIEVQRVIAYKPLVDRALELAAHRPEHCVVLQRPQALAELRAPLDRDWDELLEGAAPAAPVAVAATDPLYILYTSGTTGKPKGVVRDNGGHAVALTWSMQAVYDTGPGEVMWAASDVGWAVGHSYSVYAPLLAGATSVLYEGKPVGTPDPGAFWRVIEQHGVKTLFTAPTAFRAIKKEDPGGEHLRRYDLSAFRYLFLAGERLDPDTYHWAKDLLGGRPVVDHWWQTETGWPVAANCLGIEALPEKAGSPTKPVPGYDVHVAGDDGADVPAGDEGTILIRLPLPPGTFPTLWNDDERFVASYVRNDGRDYLTGDGGRFDEDGYLYVMGRIDDVINVAGHRLSTGEMEQIVSAHPDVAECAVIGVPDELRGQVPLGLVVLKDGSSRTRDELEAELVASVRAEIGAVACFRTAHIVQRLPKTRSGKVLRRTMRELAEGRSPQIPSTIEDPAVLEELGPTLTQGR